MNYKQITFIIVAAITVFAYLYKATNKFTTRMRVAKGVNGYDVRFVILMVGLILFFIFKAIDSPTS